MLFQVRLFCQVPQVEICEWRVKTGYKDFLFRARCHGSIYVKVDGTLCEEKAVFLTEINIKHRCHMAHRDSGKECACRAFPLEFSRLSWKGLRPDKNSRILRIEVVEGEGEILDWYPVGTRFSKRNFNHEHFRSDHPECENITYL